MILCVCKAISEEKFKKAIESAPAQGTKRCSVLGVGTDCGQCVNEAKKLMDQKNLKGFSTSKSRKFPV